MTTALDARRGLRLVTANDSPDQPVNQLSDVQIAEGVLQFQALGAEFDAEMFSPSPDHERSRADSPAARLRDRPALHRFALPGTKARRPGLDQMMADARRGRFDIVLVWASDRLARSVRHFLEVLDELNHLGIEFVSFREQLDTSGLLGMAAAFLFIVDPPKSH